MYNFRFFFFSSLTCHLLAIFSQRHKNALLKSVKRLDIRGGVAAYVVHRKERVGLFLIASEIYNRTQKNEGEQKNVENV